MRRHLSTVIVMTAMGTSLMASPQEHPTMPAGMSHDEHLALMRKDAEMKKRGALAMGFDQDATTHHFVLTATGGAIEVEVNDATDVASRAAIREHLQQIATQFRQGVFDKPFVTHGEVPPGVPVLQRLHESVIYDYQETPRGGRVRIESSNRDGLAAIHDFLRYQIAEHRTGDPTSVRK
jgi:hypothetical protein